MNRNSYMWSRLSTRLAREDCRWQELHELDWPLMNDICRHLSNWCRSSRAFYTDRNQTINNIWRGLYTWNRLPVHCDPGRKGKERKGKFTHKVTSRLYFNNMGSRHRWSNFHKKLTRLYRPIHSNFNMGRGQNLRFPIDFAIVTVLPLPRSLWLLEIFRSFPKLIVLPKSATQDSLSFPKSIETRRDIALILLSETDPIQITVTCYRYQAPELVV